MTPGLSGSALAVPDLAWLVSMSAAVYTSRQSAFQSVENRSRAAFIINFVSHCRQAVENPFVRFFDPSILCLVVPCCLACESWKVRPENRIHGRQYMNDKRQLRQLQEKSGEGYVGRCTLINIFFLLMTFLIIFPTQCVRKTLTKNKNHTCLYCS